MHHFRYGWEKLYRRYYSEIVSFSDLMSTEKPLVPTDHYPCFAETYVTISKEHDQK